MGRIRFIGAGAVLGLAWAAALRGYMMQLAGPDSVFTFGGTFGIILPAGALVDYPADVPIRGFDPAQHVIERRLAAPTD